MSDSRTGGSIGCMVAVAAAVVIGALGAMAQTAPAPVRARSPHGAPGTAVARTELRAPTTVVPFDTTSERPVVEARINGKGPYRFILDTGAAAAVVLDESLAQELELRKTGEVQAGDPSANRGIAASVSRLDSVTCGAAVFHDVACVYWPRMLPITDTAAPRGVLGFTLFRDLLLTLDLPRRRLVLERGALPAPDGAKVLPYESPRGIPIVDLEVGGRRIESHLDTGSSGGITLPDAMADSLSLASAPVAVGRARTVNSDMVVRGAALEGEMKFGGRTYAKPDLRFNALPIATVGMKLLGEFAITFDQRTRRVRFEPDTSTAPRPVVRPKRYGMRAAPDASGPLQVAAVDPGSPAERAGIKPGDVIPSPVPRAWLAPRAPDDRSTSSRADGRTRWAPPASRSSAIPAMRCGGIRRRSASRVGSAASSLIRSWSRDWPTTSTTITAPWPFPFESFGIGLSFTRLNYGEFVSDPLADYIPRELSFGGGASFRITPDLAIGAMLKWVRIELGPNANEKTLGLDLGALYRLAAQPASVSLGVNVQHLGPEVVFVNEDQGSPLSRNVKVGGAIDVPIALGNSFGLGMVTVADYNQSLVTSDFRTWNGGVEVYTGYRHLVRLGLRAGWYYDPLGDINDWTFGVGVRLFGLTADAGWIPQAQNSDLDRVMKLTGGFHFDFSREPTLALAER